MPGKKKGKKKSPKKSQKAGKVVPKTSEAIVQCFDLILKDLENQAEGCSEPLENVMVVDKAALQKYADVLSHEVTKYVLFLSKGEPELEGVASLSKVIVQHVTATVCVLRVMLQQSGATHKKAVVTATKALLTGIRSIIVQLRQSTCDRLNIECAPIADSNGKGSSGISVGTMGGGAANKKVTVESHTGAVWEYCKRLVQLPLTNADAVAKQLGQHIAMIKDAKTEMAELREDEGGDNGGGGDDDGDDDGFFDDDFDDEPLTVEEFARVKPSVEAASVALTVCKKLYEFVLKCKTANDNKAHVQWLEDQLTRAASVVTIMDDLGSSLYSPQDVPTVNHAFSSLRATMDAMLEHFPAHPEFYDNFALTFKKSKGETPEDPEKIKAACDSYISKFRSHLETIKLAGS